MIYKTDQCMFSSAFDFSLELLVYSMREVWFLAITYMNLAE